MALLMPEYTFPSHVVIQKVGEETVILNLESGHYFGLDPIGTRMLELLRIHADLQPALDTLDQEYDASPEKLRTDMLDLLQELEEQGLVVKGS